VYEQPNNQTPCCFYDGSACAAGEKPITCLNNHKGFISHPIMPLVINSLGGGHTHTHIGIMDKSNFKKPVMHQPKASTLLV